MNMKVSRKVA